MTAEWQSCVGNCLEQERLALLDIHALYSQSSGDCCGWDGVTCNDTTGRVIELYFNGAEDGSLRGGRYLNASLFLPFQQLRLLSLTSFQFLGCMENEGIYKYIYIYIYMVVSSVHSLFLVHSVHPLHNHHYKHVIYVKMMSIITYDVMNNNAHEFAQKTIEDLL
ncbi:unnamed protein product [Linum tenue]|uniref:Leucine-rich repeat-containing N-terminal plant-type domain-containing protein n=1 Tax=Linum tenue TaxID=586396 RepID=A0AAV0Q1Z4_9ROSI|nr:unnamed protein product [Linum tenue]